MIVVFWLLTNFVGPAICLQLVSVVSFAGNTIYGENLGLDFTVFTPIDVSAVGVLDADKLGIEGTLTARVMDRSNNATLIGPFNFSEPMARLSDANPFAFLNLSAPVRLQRGVYTLVSRGFQLDKFIEVGPNDFSLLSTVASSAVVVGEGFYGGGDTDILDKYDHGNIYAAATLVFTVVADPVPPLPTRSFADSEEVACAGFDAGEFNIRGKLSYCENGWMRLWRVNDSTCEQNGWTSNRSPNAIGFDPAGCRPIQKAPPSCVSVPTVRAPFLFRQVRAANWTMWLLGSPDGFDVGVDRVCDGVTVLDPNHNTVFAFAAVGATTTASCPCDSTTERLSGASWLCGLKNVSRVVQSKWNLLSADNACGGKNTWTTLATPRSARRAVHR